MNDLILIESQSARTETMSNVTDDLAINSLNKAKALTMALWQGTNIATTEQMAEFFETSVDTVQKVVQRNKDELTPDGLRKLSSKELKTLPTQVMDMLSITSMTPSLTVWTPRAALRLGLLLRDSPIAKAVRTEILDIAESKPIHDINTLLDASVVIITENERLQQEVQDLQRVRLDIAEINYKLDLLVKAAQPKQATPLIKPVQQELDLDTVQRFNESKNALLAAKTLENEAKAKALHQKFAPKPKVELATLIETNSVAAWLNTSTVIDPKAKSYIGKATGNPETHLYPNYVNYCNQHRLELLNMQIFSRALMSLVEMTLEVRLGKSRDRLGCHLIGIAIAA
jgi:hypothetical protein